MSKKIIGTVAVLAALTLNTPVALAQTTSSPSSTTVNNANQMTVTIDPSTGLKPDTDFTIKLTNALQNTTYKADLVKADGSSPVYASYNIQTDNTGVGFAQSAGLPDGDNNYIVKISINGSPVNESSTFKADSGSAGTPTPTTPTTSSTSSTPTSSSTSSTLTVSVDSGHIVQGQGTAGATAQVARLVSDQGVSYKVTGLQPNEWATAVIYGPAKDNNNFSSESTVQGHLRVQADGNGTATTTPSNLVCSDDSDCYFAVQFKGENSGSYSDFFSVQMTQDGSTAAPTSSSASPSSTDTSTSSDTSSATTSSASSVATPSPSSTDSGFLAYTGAGKVLPFLAGAAALAALGAGAVYVSRKKKEDSLTDIDTSLAESLERKSTSKDDSLPTHDRNE